MTWHVWADLAQRSHIVLAWGVIDGASALIEDLGGGLRRITLDARLDRRARRAALAHELVHDERGILFDADCPAGLVEIEERAVRAEVTRRLVPPGALGDLVATSIEAGHQVTWRTVADTFDVPRDIATEALLALARAHHPSGRAA